MAAALCDALRCLFSTTSFHLLQKKVGRAYARVSRRLLRAHLLDMCKAAGVTYLAAEVTDTEVAPDQQTVVINCSNGATCSSRWVGRGGDGGGGCTSGGLGMYGSWVQLQQQRRHLQQL
jgi:hypothetical protein